MNRLIISKTSWGIVIFYEIKELLDLSKDANDVQEVLPSIYLKLNDQKLDDVSFEYLMAGIKSIIQHIKISPVTFSIEKLQYNICDYQPEGMYYMFRKWFFETYDMEMPPINVYYDKEVSRYVFPDLLNQFNKT
ncbi:hypothetical protein QE422_000561 [Chryseobacterium sp. SORGH_AS 447]|uniref:hypothetical protein n=1 Tax=Chryseobacterium sp. SORGH_AS_0447 TaxID=3041769 RepID=UPI00277E49D9|nr:hypothetical protein [Chryseobacterium sp. SORGH_AS_0447]MDQ1160193.1 hypothetical protein [Chryseobacterium sp. SORGH_AS_0447]